MLGSMVHDYFFQQNKHELRGTLRPKPESEFFLNKYGRDNFYFFDAESADWQAGLEKILVDFQPEVIINCIGIIKPYCKDDDPTGVVRAIRINALFPHLLTDLAKKVKSKIIQIATDCVYSGQGGRYQETSPHDALDVYGKTKSLGEAHAENILHLRCSIIGPELKGKLSLLEWFLGQPEGSELKGFTHHRWNGVTTLQFARVCHEIVDGGESYWQKLISISPVHHYTPNEEVNKYQLLNIFKEVFNKNFTVQAVDSIGQPVDRTLVHSFGLLASDQSPKPMSAALRELRDYLVQRNFFQ